MVWFMSNNASSDPLSTVTEPSIWLSWMQDHWNKEYIQMAKKIILDLVCVNTDVST